MKVSTEYITEMGTFIHVSMLYKIMIHAHVVVPINTILRNNRPLEHQAQYLSNP